MISRHILADMCRLSTLSYRSTTQLSDLFGDLILPPTNEFSVLDKCYTCPTLIQGDLSEESSIIQNDCQAYACRYQDSLSIVFRGTESFRDVLTDLNMVRVRMDLPNIENRPKVHWGFLRQFRTVEDQVREQIEEYLEEKKNVDATHKQIIFSGHSLGGALSTLASVQFGREYPDIPISCVTFGSPRVGNSHFCHLFDQCVQHSYRFVNEDDPVPMGPTPLRFRHVKGGLWIDDDELLRQKPLFRSLNFIKNFICSLFGYTSNPVSDHGCKNYLDFMSQKYGR